MSAEEKFIPKERGFYWWLSKETNSWEMVEVHHPHKCPWMGKVLTDWKKFGSGYQTALTNFLDEGTFDPTPITKYPTKESGSILDKFNWKPIIDAPRDQTPIIATHIDNVAGVMHVCWRVKVGSEDYINPRAKHGLPWRPTHFIRAWDVLALLKKEES